MRTVRVYVEQPLQAGTTATLDATAAAHVTRVLRLREGDPVTLFDGRGSEYPARIGPAQGRSVSAQVLEAHAVDRESPLALTLVQGISRGERMDLVVQKATELGVRRIVPVLTARSVVRLDAEQAARRLQHWRAITIAACEQCGRNRLPEVAAPLTLREFLSARPGARAGADTGADPGTRLLLVPGAPATLHTLTPLAAGVTLLIGPEGGLEDDERAAATAAGFTGMSLGPRILRTETAALAALAVLQCLHGDL